MSKKYDKLALEIVKKVGGKDNVNTLTHCMTRLRFVLNDAKKADKDGLNAMDGVINVVEAGGQFQVVVGTHVAQVYEEIVDKGGISSNDNAAPKDENVGIGAKILDFISGVFAPIIPAIAGAGMIRALLSLLLLFNLISRDSQSYYIVNFMSDAVFYFLPILLAYTAANKLKCNPAFSMVLAGILLHPNFSNLRAAGEAVSIFGIPVRLVSYGSSVIPIFLIVLLQVHVERIAKKITPNSVKVIFVPMITVFVTGIIGITLLGPIGSFVGDFMAAGLNILNSHGSWIIIILMATFWPLLVMFGIHYSIGPLSVAQLTSLGIENIIGPGAIISNISQGVAALTVGFVTKEKALKQISASTGITALMGITEPALYGVTLPKKYPLIAAMLGGACGGIYAGATNIYRYAVGASGLPAIPLYIGENIWNLYNILIALVITTISTAVFTYIFALKYEKGTAKEKDVETETDTNTIAV